MPALLVLRGGQATLTVADLRLTQSYDGDGRRARREEHAVTRVNNGSPQTSVETTYYVRSSVLGGRAVAELNSEGQKQKGYVYAAGEVVVKQWAGHLYWQQQNPVTGSARETSTEGYTYASEGNVELDPQGRDVGAADPYAVEDEVGVADYSGTYEVAGNGFDGGGQGCAWPDGMPAPCNVVAFAKSIGLYDLWENPVQVVERDREVGWQGRPWDTTPDFMGRDYWAGAGLQSSSELGSTQRTLFATSSASEQETGSLTKSCAHSPRPKRRA